MDCLLFGGAPNVGKSETIFRLANRLVSVGFRIVNGSIPASFNDFRVVLEGTNKTGTDIKIIINSATDTVDIINNFKNFYDSNGGSYDIMISSVRDHNFWPRNNFFRIMNINSTKDFILEIPLAKITRRDSNKIVALNWYEEQIDALVKHTLSNTPFNL